MNRDTASQQIRASTDPFGHGRSRTQITQFGVESGGYLGNPDCRTERQISADGRDQRATTDTVIVGVQDSEVLLDGRD